jgi:sigma-E factor negative regulatory protein RseB
MKAVALTRCLVLVLCAWTGLLPASDRDDPRAMLERMGAAMSQMSYQGTFVYVQGDTVETIRITHVADHHGVRERLVSVSGEPREILRDSSGVRWVLADDHSVFEDPGFNLSFFPDLPLDGHDRTELSYSMKTGPVGRIAGHKARNLEVLPRDQYRYGYSLWLEEHSGLLLKWELIDGNRKPLAKLMFTDFRLGSEVDSSELSPGSQLKKFKTTASELPTGRGLSNADPKWQPSSLPPGFRMTAHRYFGSDGDGIYEHLVYSDGLAAVSVYIESVPEDIEQRPGMSRMGTTHAYSRMVGDLLITVVGDVPAITVQTIADSVSIVTP